MAVDNQGNVAAAGGTQNTETSLDFTVANFDREGTLLWQQTLNGTANSRDEARSVALDNQGNVVAAGEIQNTGTGEDVTVVKFDREGTLLWQQTLNGTANAADQARSVAVDNKGNVAAAGITRNTGTSSDFTVAKFDRDGTLLWQQTLNGTANGFDEAFSVAVDNQGNVAAAGGTQNTSAPPSTLRWRSSTATAPYSGSRPSRAPPTLLTRRPPWRLTKRGTWSPPASL